jgi:hypothetical protein
LAKMVRASLWAIFSQTHLFALSPMHSILCWWDASRDRIRSIINNDKSSAIGLKQRQVQGCQMVCFQTIDPNLGKFWRILQWKMLVYFIDPWSILRFFCYILWTFWYT